MEEKSQYERDRGRHDEGGEETKRRRRKERLRIFEVRLSSEGKRGVLPRVRERTPRLRSKSHTPERCV